MQNIRIQAQDHDEAQALAMGELIPSKCWRDCEDFEGWNYPTEQESDEAADFDALTGPTGKLEKCTCPECGGHNIAFDSFVFWNPDTQTFELGEVMDKGHICNDCGSRIDHPKWEPLTLEDCTNGGEG